MTTQIVDNPEAGRYEIYLDTELAGFAEYHLHQSEIAFIHTEVDKKFEGQGLASQLARYALDDSREQGRAVLPYCPYIRRWVQKHPDYADLVPASHRERFGL